MKVIALMAAHLATEQDAELFKCSLESLSACNPDYILVSYSGLEVDIKGGEIPLKYQGESAVPQLMHYKLLFNEMPEEWDDDFVIFQDADDFSNPHRADYLRQVIKTNGEVDLVLAKCRVEFSGDATTYTEAVSRGKIVEIKAQGTDYFMLHSKVKHLRPFFHLKSEKLLKNVFADMHLTRFLLTTPMFVAEISTTPFCAHREHESSLTQNLQKVHSPLDNIIDNLLYMCLPLSQVVEQLNGAGAEIPFSSRGERTALKKQLRKRLPRVLENFEENDLPCSKSEYLECLEN